MALCFLGALFSCTTDWVKKHGSKPAQFREFMTEGQTMDSHGAGRIDFYKSVCVEARKVSARIAMNSATSIDCLLRSLMFQVRGSSSQWNRQ